MGRKPNKAAQGNRANPAQKAVGEAAAALQRGDLNEGTRLLDAALKRWPSHPDLLHLYGQVAMHRGEPAAARQLIEKAIAVAPGTAVFHYSLGNVLAAGGELQRAADAFREALRRDSQLVEAHVNLGLACAHLDQHDQAYAAYLEAAKLRPQDPSLFLSIAACCKELGKRRAMTTAVERVLALVARPDAALLAQIGSLYADSDDTAAAVDFYRRATQQAPDVAEHWFALGQALTADNQFEAAAEAYSAARERGQPAATVQLAEARLEARRGRVALARAHLSEVAAAAWDDPDLLLEAADEAGLLGEFERQHDWCRRVLELHPDEIRAYAGITATPGALLEADDLARLQALLDDPALDAETRSRLGFLLGNWYRQQRDYDRAFACYAQGNAARGEVFDCAAYAKWIDNTVARYSKTFFAERTAGGSASQRPVLIVGMPRSGTTLVEQVLDAHPDVLGAGELGFVSVLSSVPGRQVAETRVDAGILATLDDRAREAHAAAYLARLEALDNGANRYVVNKMPHNFDELGLFALLFPAAPVIHVRRDPRDNLLSIFFASFAHGVHHYAYDLRDLGHYYRQYERLVAHWMAVIPNPVLEVRYEDLVADLSAGVARLSEFLSLTPDPAMLQFHQSDRKVSTASYWQVRQPLYSSSVGRWRQYERHLGPLLKALEHPEGCFAARPAAG